ncbi:MAG: hypothetical protein P8R45_10335, partial [Candidatus Binatia bacterium]|nr:hypothetical protein [Candidatus Binatia bacterium]
MSFSPGRCKQSRVHNDFLTGLGAGEGVLRRVRLGIGEAMPISEKDLLTEGAWRQIQAQLAAMETMV